MKGISFFVLLLGLRKNKRLLSCVAIVDNPYFFDIWQCKPSVFAIEVKCEFFEIFEGGTDVDFGAVEEDWDDGLGGTCICDYLICEEDGLVVVLEVKAFLVLLLPFKQENQTINWFHRIQKILIIQRIKLLNNDSFNTNPLD